MGAMAGFVFATTSSGLSSPCDQHSNHFTLLLHISVFLRDFLFARSQRDLNPNPPTPLWVRMLSTYTRLLISATTKFTVVRTVLNWLVLWQHTSIWLYTHYSIIINKTCIFLSYLLTLIDNRPCSRFSLEVSLFYHTFNHLSRGFSKIFFIFFQTVTELLAIAIMVSFSTSFKLSHFSAILLKISLVVGGSAGILNFE